MHAFTAWQDNSVIVMLLLNQASCYMKYIVSWLLVIYVLF